MKYLIALFLLTAVFSSCKKDTFQTDFELSREAWLAFKKASNNTYTYTVSSASWAGFGDSTIISVTNGNVSSRKYTNYSIDGQTGQKTTRESWTETTPTLNSHPLGAAPLNLDAVYEKAAKEWLKADPKLNTVYLEINNQGMISTCGYVPAGCMDDCFTGIRIVSITATQAAIYKWSIL